MEQKFVKMDDAVEMLGVSADRLNELRENGLLRAYRDGPSWKFRGDEIEKMLEEGVPELPPPSDLSLSDDLEPLALETEESSLELKLDDTDTTAGSELENENLEDTVTAGTSDLALDLSDEPSDLSDSILLSEEELGESVGPAGSTIIGKDSLKSEDADLELALDGDDDTSASQSDVKLASPGVSNVLSDDSDDVLDLELASSNSGGASAFEDLEELEIDLAAESSRILGPDDVSKAQAAAASMDDESDLSIDDSSPLTEGDSDMGSTDVPLEALASADDVAAGSDSEIDLAVDDDLVLSDSEGSDITLESGDSGINLAPADSGLALDDIPLEMGGSAILSSLDLGGGASDPEISLVGSDADVSDISDISALEDEPEAELQVDDDFQLTPLSEGSPEGDGDSSSQVIALDAGIEGLDDDDLGDDVGVLDDVGFSEDAGDGVMLADDFSEAPADGLDMGAYAGVGGAAASTEVPYSVGQIVLLFSCVTFLALGGVMMMDMVRNIWSWDQPYTINSTVIDALLNIF